MKLKQLSLAQKPTYTKIAEDVDFFVLFQKIEQEFDTCFLYESLGEEGKFSRYSIIGFAPEQIISARENVLKIDDEEVKVKNPYAALRELMPEKVIAREYAGGLVGYLSYEAVNYFETSMHVQVHDRFDQFVFGVYTDGIIYDKLTNEVFYFFYENDRSETIRELMKKDVTAQQFTAKFVRDTSTEEAYCADVEKVKEQIRAGNTFQCEVGSKSEYEVTGNPIVMYEKLREVNPSPFMYYLKFGKKVIAGASPELLFSLRDGEMTTKPLAGTALRGKDDREDQQFARELLNDPKEQAEHKMLVDMHRNDIGKVAKIGTVKVKDFMTVKRFSHVQHISSDITGLISDKEDMFSSLASNFPAGTLSGAPKIESIKIIDANEKAARGPYGGGVGQFGFNGDCTFAIAIRSLFVDGEYAYSQTSAGIVYDSVPEKEYEEVRRKLAAMKKVLVSFEK